MNRFQELVEGYLEGSLSKESLETLAQMVHDDNELRERFIELAQVEGMLYSKYIAEPYRDAMVERTGKCLGGSINRKKTGKDVLRKIKNARSKRQKRGMFKKIIWLTIAACIAIIIGVHFYNVEQAEETPDLIRATLIQMSQGVRVIRQGESVPAKAGMDIIVGDTIETRQGQKATLQYNGEDTLISIAEKTDVTIQEEKGAKRIDLDAGKIECKVAPQEPGRPFRVSTDFANAIVKGTVFTVAASQDRTRLEVLEGSVDFSNASGTDTVNVTQGFFAQTGSSGRIVTDRISTISPEQKNIRLPFTDTSRQGARVDIEDNSLTIWKDSPSSRVTLGSASYIEKFDPGDTVNITGELILGPAAGSKEYGAYAEFDIGDMNIRLVFDKNGRVALESRKEAGNFTTHAQRTLNAEEPFTFNLTITPGRAVCYVNSRLLYEGETFFRPGSAYSFWFRSFCLQPGKVAVFRNISVERNPLE